MQFLVNYAVKTNTTPRSIRYKYVRQVTNVLWLKYTEGSTLAYASASARRCNNVMAAILVVWGYVKRKQFEE